MKKKLKYKYCVVHFQLQPAPTGESWIKNKNTTSSDNNLRLLLIRFQLFISKNFLLFPIKYQLKFNGLKNDTIWF